MAIYHLNVRGCSPATGAGAVKKAAYQSGQTLIEERTGEVCDYARKERVLDEGLALPAGVPPVGRGELWNEAERVWVEGGGGKTLVAKRYEFALPMSAGASRAPPARNSIAKTFSIVGGLTSTRKPCRRAAATTPPTSGAISASFRLPKLGGGLPDTEAIPHGITALPGMCAMTQTAPRSCWRRGRASTTGCPTVVRTMGVRGGKRKNGEGQNPSPFR